MILVFDRIVKKNNQSFTLIPFYLYQKLSGTVFFIIGIKHDFSFINIRKVLREVLKTEGEPSVFNTSLRTLRMLMTDKIMFDRYYCINSKKTHRIEKMFAHFILQPYHNFLTCAAFL